MSPMSNHTIDSGAERRNCQGDEETKVISGRPLELKMGYRAALHFRFPFKTRSRVSLGRERYALPLRVIAPPGALYELSSYRMFIY